MKKTHSILSCAVVLSLAAGCTVYDNTPYTVHSQPTVYYSNSRPVRVAPPPRNRKPAPPRYKASQAPTKRSAAVNKPAGKVSKRQSAVNNQPKYPANKSNNKAVRRPANKSNNKAVRRPANKPVSESQRKSR